jgi:hypothetical protein
MNRCINCGHEFHQTDSREVNEPGGIYSEAGAREIQISGFCEYCFDLTTDYSDEDENNF